VFFLNDGVSNLLSVVRGREALGADTYPHWLDRV
jgi:hypothetical protein